MEFIYGFIAIIILCIVAIEVWGVFLFFLRLEEKRDIFYE